MFGLGWPPLAALPPFRGRAGAGPGGAGGGGVMVGRFGVKGGQPQTVSLTVSFPPPLSLPPPLQGRDHTLFALTPGIVRFSRDGKTGRKTVAVVPAGE